MSQINSTGASAGKAFKNMARQNMMRGNRGDAQAITDFGISGMRSNLKVSENSKTAPKNIVSDVYKQDTIQRNKKSLGNANTKDVNKRLATSILDALQ
jgi:hypothetical protein